MSPAERFIGWVFSVFVLASFMKHGIVLHGKAVVLFPVFFMDFTIDGERSRVNNIQVNQDTVTTKSTVTRIDFFLFIQWHMQLFLTTHLICSPPHLPAHSTIKQPLKNDHRKYVTVNKNSTTNVAKLEKTTPRNAMQVYHKNADAVFLCFPTSFAIIPRLIPLRQPVTN